MHILLTGAKGGIGSTIHTTLVSKGHTVTALTRDELNLENPSSIKAWFETYSGEPFDWLVCAHGFIDSQTEFIKMQEDAIEKTFRVNILSVIYLAQAMLPLLTKGGGIVALSSSAGVTANGRYAPYSASKAALNTFIQALARNQEGVRCVALAPGPTHTQMRAKVATDAQNQQPAQAVADEVLKALAGHYASGDVVLVKNGESSVVSKL